MDGFNLSSIHHLLLSLCHIFVVNFFMTAHLIQSVTSFLLVTTQESLFCCHCWKHSLCFHIPLPSSAILIHWSHKYLWGTCYWYKPDNLSSKEPDHYPCWQSETPELQTQKVPTEEPPALHCPDSACTQILTRVLLPPSRPSYPFYPLTRQYPQELCQVHLVPQIPSLPFHSYTWNDVVTRPPSK